MPDFTDTTAPFGVPAPAADNCALSALLLESLSAIAAECDLLHRTTLQYSLDRHIYAIEACIAEMVQEIAGKGCGRA